MNIKIINFEVDTQTINPTLAVGLDLEYSREVEMPVLISGKITLNNKKICLLDEYDVNTEHSIELKPYSNENKNKHMNNPLNNGSYYVQLTGELSSKAIEYVDDMRKNNPEKSVVFYIRLLVKVMEIPGLVNQLNQNANSLLRLKTRTFNLDHTIKHSDWIYKFATPLGIGNFMLVEMEIPDKHKVDPFWMELYDRLYLRLKDIHEAIQYGDLKKVMYAGRQFYENIKIGDKKVNHIEFENKLRELFKEDQHSDEGFQNFIDAIWKFFEYNSKFIHDKDKKNELLPIPNPTKEDAYFMYMLALGLLNVIGKKISVYKI